MNFQTRWLPIPARLLFLMLGAFLALAAVAAPAHAGDTGGNGSTDGGAGICRITGWNASSSFSDFLNHATDGGSDVAGDGCGNPYCETYTASGCTQNLSDWPDSLDGSSCKRATDSFALLWLRDQNGTWASHKGGFNNLTKDYFTSQSQGSSTGNGKAINQLILPGGSFNAAWNELVSLDDSPSDGIADKNLQKNHFVKDVIDQAVSDQAFGNLPATFKTDRDPTGYGALKNALYDALGGNDRDVTVLCVSDQPGQTSFTCSDLVDWGSPYNYGSTIIHPSGVSGSTKFANPAVAEAGCYVRCPSTATAHPSELIPSAYTSANQQADYCSPPTKHTEYAWTSGLYGITQIFTADTSGGTQPYGWTTLLVDETPTVTGESTFPVNCATGAGCAYVESSFGTQLYDKYCSSGMCSSNPNNPAKGTCQAFQTDYDAYKDAWKTNAHAAVNLTTDEKQAMGEGRTITVKEMTTYAAAVCVHKQDLLMKRVYWTYLHADGTPDASRTVNLSNGSSATTPCASGPTDGSFESDGKTPSHSTYSPSGCSTGSWVKDPASDTTWKKLPDGSSQDGSTHAVDYALSDLQEQATPGLTQAYQLLTNHCNNSGFNSVANTGTTVKSNGFDGIVDSQNSDRYYSASAVSKVYTGGQLSSGARLPWGASSGNASAQPSFYDRLCVYDGKLADPATNHSASESDLTNSEAGFGKASWTFFRSGSWYNTAVRYFVPDTDAMGEQPTVGDGYTKTSTTIVKPETWTFNYQYYGITGYKNQTTTTQVTDYSRPYYYGYFTESLKLCDTGVANVGHVAWSGTNDWSSGGPWKPASGNATANKGAIQYGLQWLKCNSDPGAGPVDKGDGGGNWYKERDYYLTSTTYPYTKAQTTTTSVAQYGWITEPGISETNASAANSLMSICSDYPNEYRNCSVSDTPATTTVNTETGLASCVAGPTSGYPGTAGSSTSTCQHLSHAGAKESVVKYADGEAPVQTILTRDLDGTPSVDPASGCEGTCFQLEAASCANNTSAESGGVFNTSTKATPSQTQFQLGNFSSSTVAIVAGCYSKVNTEALWASNNNRPQVMTVRWRFAPIVSDQTGVANVGFGATGGGATWTQGEVDAHISGLVSSVNSGTTSPATSTLKQMEWNSSGTGSTDDLDQGVAWGVSKAANKTWIQKPSAFSPFYYAINYVRSVQE